MHDHAEEPRNGILVVQQLGAKSGDSGLTTFFFTPRRTSFPGHSTINFVYHYTSLCLAFIVGYALLNMLHAIRVVLFPFRFGKDAGSYEKCN